MYNMASQHNSTTDTDKGPEEPHSIQYKQGTHDPSFRAYKQRKHYMYEYRHLQMKKAKEPDYLQHPIKIVAEVQATCRSPRKH